MMRCGVYADIIGPNGEVDREGVWITAEFNWEGKKAFRYIWDGDDGYLHEGLRCIRNGYSYRPVPCEVVCNGEPRSVQGNIIYDDDVRFVIKYKGETSPFLTATYSKKDGAAYRRIEQPVITEVFGIQYKATEEQVKKQLEGLETA